MVKKLVVFLVVFILAGFLVLADSQEITLTSEDFMKEFEHSDERYSAELISATDSSANIRVSQMKELSFIQGGTVNVGGVNVKLVDASETNLELSANILIENGRGERFLLTSLESSREFEIDGERYTIEIVSGNDLSSRIKVTKIGGLSEEKEILEREIERVNGLFVSVLMSDENNLQISSDVIVGYNRFVLTEKEPTLEFEIEDERYKIELLSATDFTANLRVSQSKEVSEGSSKEIGGIEVRVIEADETNLALSATISVGDSSEEEEEENEEVIEDDNEDEEEDTTEEVEGNSNIEEQEVDEEKRPDCNGCLFGDVCYDLGYRKDGKFCSENKEFVSQLEEGNSCQNNFECSSNVCISGECISPNLIQRIINFFKRLFGLS